MIQMGQTALSNGCHTLEQRLARWLLMCHDRVDGDDLSTTHEFLSLMLGVRRAGVTVALQALEDRGTIATKCDQITVQDRAKLEEVAGDSYGVPEAEYARLFGSSPDGSRLWHSLSRSLPGWMDQRNHRISRRSCLRCSMPR